VATHAITGHQVALKFINRAKITTADMNARVKREIQYLKVLRHPHIIKLCVHYHERIGAVSSDVTRGNAC
jgi:serine/threonine protein kinase